MNERKILGVLLIVGLAKAAFGGHRHREGTRGNQKWHDRIAELHQELHCREAHTADAEAGTASA